MTSEKTAWIWPVLLAGTIFTLSGSSQIAVPDIELSFSKDKLAHFLVFGLLTTSILRIPYFKKRGWRGALYAALIVIGFGAIDEFRQSFTPGRSVEFADWIADTLGAIVAAIAYRCIHPYRQILEFRVGGKKDEEAT